MSDWCRSSERRDREKLPWIPIDVLHELASMDQVVHELLWHLQNHAAVRVSQRIGALFVKNISSSRSAQFLYELSLAQIRHDAPHWDLAADRQSSTPRLSRCAYVLARIAGICQGSLHRMCASTLH